MVIDFMLILYLLDIGESKYKERKIDSLDKFEKIKKIHFPRREQHKFSDQ